MPSDQVTSWPVSGVMLVVCWYRVIPQRGRGLRRAKVDWEKACAELSEYGRLCVERRLVVGSAGNISLRLTDGEFIISRRGARLDRLTPRDFVRCTLHDEMWIGEAQPSTETPMHRAIYRVRPEAHAVLHSSAFYTTLVACSDIELRTDLVPESMAYLDRIGRVPYFHPGTAELARAAQDQALDGRNVILLENHGLLVWAGSLDEALLLSEMMEHFCQLLVFGRLGRETFELRWLGTEVQKDFERLRYARRGTSPKQ